MRKIISVCLIIFISLFIAIEYSSKIRGIKVVENFLNSFYTVSDLSNFDSIKYQLYYPNTEFDDILKELTTEQAFDELICDRLSLSIIMGAYNNKFITSVKNIHIKKDTELDTGIVYNYSLDLVLKYIDKEKIVKENVKGQLTVSKIKVNGSEKWLISKINKLTIPKSFLSKNK